MAATATGSKVSWVLQARREAGAAPQRAVRTGVGAYHGGLPPTACYYYDYYDYYYDDYDYDYYD